MKESKLDDLSREERRAIIYLKEVEETFQDEREKYEMFLGFMKAFKAQRIDTNTLISKVHQLFKGNNNLIIGFNAFLPKGDKITAIEEEPRSPDKFEDAIQFYRKIKKRFENDYHVCESFHQILKMCNNKVITDVYHEVAALFSGHQDLIDEFRRFLPKDSSTSSLQQLDDQHGQDRAFISNLNDGNTIVELLEDQRESDEKEDRERIHCNEGDAVRNSSRAEEPESKSTEVEERENKQKCETEVINRRASTRKLIPKLDLSSCEQCTPSYRFLPDNYPIASASERSELEAEVLNDNLISISSGRENFKHKLRNPHEMILLRCEEDQFELDILTETMSATVKRGEELLKSLIDNTTSLDNPIRIQDHFTASELRCIERLYGDHGPEVIDILRNNPSVTLPPILTRLKQKLEESNKFRSDFNKIWANVHAKTSLDQRSLNFKQHDPKTFRTKALVTEIKEIKEKMQKVGDKSIIPNLVFEYSNNEIHEDLYKLIEYSCDEICTTKEQFNKAINLWTTFLEPMLGVASRSSSLEIVKEAEKAKSCTQKAIKGNIGKGHGDKSIIKADSLTGNEGENCVQDAGGEKGSRVFYGNDAFYVLFRLHRVLYERILLAKLNSTKDWSPPDSYASFINALYKLLEGSSDDAKFEEECRAIVGNESYVLYTLDKLIYKLVKKIQAICEDETHDNLLRIFKSEKYRTGDKFVDYVYYENVNSCLRNQNIYRIECSFAPCHLSIQLMDDGKYKD